MAATPAARTLARRGRAVNAVCDAKIPFQRNGFRSGVRISAEAAVHIP
ncbi:hypothetical protein [Xanthobacter sediminis]